ncbi:E3 ubiquitin-protein ligase TRIM71-like [Saccostrea cucullata]|uniref:E3 ubiquitin-protein ligase TRIM71-like n=1 Tax=Saccostrea cuccullata TaxID=36930 RepID=UPI002ED535F0
MGSAQGQDVIRCHICSNPVEHHCNLCHVDLCFSCIPKHMADKSREHEIVGYTSRKEKTVLLPICLQHKKNRCETYCQECEIPICLQCMMGSHKKHEFTHIDDIIQKQKQQITSDTKEIENTILPRYKNDIISSTTADFYKALSAVKEQEDKICRAVREVGLQFTDVITKQRKEAMRKNKGSQTLAEKAEKQLNGIVQKNKDILRDSDATAVIKYRSRNKDFQKGPEFQRISCPQLYPGIISKDQIVAMFGFLKTQDYLQKVPRMLMMGDPQVLSNIQSPYGNDQLLWHLHCMGTDKILISGDDSTIKEIDKDGSILKTIHTNENVRVLTSNLQLEPVFCLSTFSYNKTNIYIYKDCMKLLLSIPDWIPVGLCYTVDGDLLVSMRSTDKTQSRIVRFSGTAEKQKLQYDTQRQPLFSTGVLNVLPLTENGNGDICVADYVKRAVVVIDFSGVLRFRYLGNLSKQSKYQEFKPSNIATDVNAQILISDNINNIVHVINSYGNFLRYIENQYNYGGLSVDADHNLVLGDLLTGKIQIIKYLK